MGQCRPRCHQSSDFFSNSKSKKWYQSTPFLMLATYLLLKILSSQTTFHVRQTMPLGPKTVTSGEGFKIKVNGIWGTSLALQYLGVHASTAGCMGLISGQGTKIPHATQYSPPKKKKKKIDIWENIQTYKLILKGREENHIQIWWILPMKYFYVDKCK